jgi:hypothetical protein
MRFELWTRGINPDTLPYPDLQAMSILLPLKLRMEFDRDAAAVNKGMFGGR